ncbi:hypothetical protein D3C80_2106160 [compost metagenome]
MVIDLDSDTRRRVQDFKEGGLQRMRSTNHGQLRRGHFGFADPTNGLAIVVDHQFECRLTVAVESGATRRDFHRLIVLKHVEL